MGKGVKGKVRVAFIGSPLVDFAQGGAERRRQVHGNQPIGPHQRPSPAREHQNLPQLPRVAPQHGPTLGRCIDPVAYPPTPVATDGSRFTQHHQRLGGGDIDGPTDVPRSSVMNRGRPAVQPGPASLTRSPAAPLHPTPTAVQVFLTSQPHSLPIPLGNP